MIPNNITRDSILEAIKYVEKQGIPKERNSKLYKLSYNDKHYPPKYILSIANFIANGKELPPYDFKGGKETNNFLKERGFDIVKRQ